MKYHHLLRARTWLHSSPTRTGKLEPNNYFTGGLGGLEHPARARGADGPLENSEIKLQVSIWPPLQYNATNVSIGRITGGSTIITYRAL